MSKALHASRPAIVLFAALITAACSQSQVESAETGTGHSPGSSAGLPVGHTDAGDKRAHIKGKATGQSCVDCHGAEGNAPIDASYPKLGGQYADYIAHALQAYRRGDRQHVLMTPQATDLSDQDIADLAAYFGSRSTQLRDLQGVK